MTDRPAHSTLWRFVRSVGLPLGALAFLLVLLWLGERTLARSALYSEYRFQGEKTNRRSARAQIHRLLSQEAAEVFILGQPGTAGSPIQAELPVNRRYDLQPGDLCIVSLQAEDGKTTAKILGPCRDRGLLVLFGLFLLTVVLTMRGKGLRTLLSLGLAAALMVWLFVPWVVGGRDPVWLAVGISVVVCAGGILAIGGVNRKSCHAVMGSVGAVVMAGGLPWLLCRQLDLTGLEVEFGLYYHLDVPLWYSLPLGRVDFAAVLIAGMVISGLGAVMDMAMTVATAIAELRQADPDVRKKRVWEVGTAVGHDVLGMMAITLLFVYAGTNLEMLLLSQVMYENAGQWCALLNYEEISAEVIRLIGCGVGLVLAVPLTALAAALLHGETSHA